jgi:hypothetical protein
VMGEAVRDRELQATLEPLKGVIIRATV